MRRFYTATLVLIALAVGSVSISAQTSDYQVKKNFEDRYAELKSSITEAMTVKEIDSLRSEIKDFAYYNEDHEQLLDNALYPETYESTIEELKQRARAAEHKLLIIENQNEKLTQLSNELSTYKSEIANLNERTDSLRNAILASEESESDLSQLVERYRKSMEERDEFVLNMIDSLFITYKDLQGKALAEFTEENGPRALQEEDNPLHVIESVIEENIQILKADNGALQTEDYLRMYVVQNRFSEVWNQIGDDLTRIYAGNKASQWENNIEDKLGDWKASASKNMWASMDSYLEKNNVDLGAFDSNESFYKSIEQFVSKATDASREKVITDENYADFQSFYDFWNGKIKKDWGKFVQEGEVLTMNQISTIDTEIMTWRDEAKPKSFLIPILFGLSLLTIVGLIIVLARK
ncbi:MAG: hypothetical protein JJ953_10035 [Gracilimonas sp.]|uniref:hypothetical protein n=1 Tax=Gracilimonas TaxID=649462 RepID=UPI001B05CE75|nr:hypothetical protein [Gracilimonas sp.]MBO6586432.1 hypothetical protein [Gracilimonas sp.]MBO6615089.1 hypothetical protein [Gracilimonas sp.]